MDRNAFIIEIDGETDAQPTSIPSVDALEFASAMVGLVTKIAARSDNPVHFHGIEIVDKCTQFVMGVDNVPAAREAAAATLRILSGTDIPRGLRDPVDRVRQSLSRLERADLGAKVMIDTLVRDVRTEGGDDPRAPIAVEVLRCIPVRAGGESPAVRFKDAIHADEQPFTLATSKQQAQELGALLYTEVEVTAEIVRLKDGQFESGQLVSFERVASNSSDAWRTWFAPNAPYWDGMDANEVLRELDRDPEASHG